MNSQVVEQSPVGVHHYCHFVVKNADKRPQLGYFAAVEEGARPYRSIFAQVWGE